MARLASAVVSARSRVEAAKAPLLTLGVVLTGTIVVAGRNPEQPGHYPTCPFLALTGWWCPGCGGLRAVHALAHGDVGTAIDRNVLVVAALPLVTAAWFWWVARRLWPGWVRALPIPSAAIYSILVGALAFGLARNTGAGAWLAP